MREANQIASILLHTPKYNTYLHTTIQKNTAKVVREGSGRRFCDDVSIQNWNSDLPNVNELFIEFHSKLQGCAERHAPLKKTFSQRN